MPVVLQGARVGSLIARYPGSDSPIGLDYVAEGDWGDDWDDDDWKEESDQEDDW